MSPGLDDAAVDVRADVGGASAAEFIADGMVEAYLTSCLE